MRDGVVGILAGGGPLPARVAEAVRAQGREVFIIGFSGFVDEALLAPFPHICVRLAAAGEILAQLRAYRCREVVLIGPVRRPSWRDLRPDGEGARLLARLGKAVFAGDDGLLGAIVRVLEEEGFVIRGADEFLHEEYAPSGLLGQYGVDEQAKEDIQRATQILSRMAILDIGQSCVVQNGLVLAVEALEGTDAMLQRCRMLKQPGPGGILLKMPKKGQERRADMPVIGPLTIQGAAEAGLRGVAFASGEILLLQKEACIEEADRRGLFLYGIDNI